MYILCVDDQKEVLNALAADLDYFEKFFRIEACESAGELLELMDDLDADGEKIALIISDHVMPGKSGVELLIEINKESRFEGCKKMLLTGLATHEDTITAINQASIDKYVEKPYQKDNLITTVKELITAYILEMGIDYTEYTQMLDQNYLFEYLRRNG